MNEAVHRLARGLEGRQTGLDQHPSRRRGGMGADPAGQHRPRHGGGAFGDNFRGLLRRGDGGRRVDRQHGIDVAVAAQGVERRAVARRRRIADDVDRIGARPGRRQHHVETLDGRRLERRQRAAQFDQRVGRQNAQPAAVAEDGQPVAEEAMAGAQRGDGLEQLVEIGDPQHAGAAEGGVVDGVRPRHRPGMRQRGALGRRAAAGLDDDHRLGAGGGAGGRHELAGVADRLDVEQDGAGFGVDRQVVEHVAEIDVAHVAQRHDMREANAPIDRPVEHRGDDRARLRHEGEAALAGMDMGEGRVEPGAGRLDAEAVRPDDSHQRRPRRFQHRLRSPLAFLVAALREAGGDDDGRLRAAPGQLAHDAGNGLRRGGDHRQFRRGRERGDRAIGASAGNLRGMWVDRPELAGEAAARQILRQHRAHRVRLARRADQRHRLRREQRAEIGDRHGGSGCDEAELLSLLAARPPTKPPAQGWSCVSRERPATACRGPRETPSG